MKLNNEIWKYVAMITQVGLSMLAPIVLCVFVGVWLDDRFGWYTTVPLLILGILAGGRNTWKLLKELTETEGTRKKQ